MKVNQYELDLLIESILSSLTKVKRKRGSCEKIFIAPIIKNIPEDFKGW